MLVFDIETTADEFDRDLMWIAMCEVPIALRDGDDRIVPVGIFDVLKIKPRPGVGGFTVSAAWMNEEQFVPLTGDLKKAALDGIASDPRDAEKFNRLVEHWHWCVAVQDGDLVDDGSNWRAAV